MLSLYLSRRLKVLSLLFFSFLAVSGFFVSPPCHGACEFLSADFASSTGWTANQDTGYWTIQGGMLDVEDIAVDSMTRAGVDFSPTDFFSVDVDVNIVSSDQYDAVGIYFFTSYDVLFYVEGDSENYTTDGVAALYYPAAGLLEFVVWDIMAREWAWPQAAHPVSGAVSSIGLSMVADGVIIRVNGQDTNFKISGNFSFGPDIIDTLRLLATGTGLHARFDNVCASAYEVTNVMSLPTSAETVLMVSPADVPVISIDPAQANPFGFGAAASGGVTLSLTAGISGLAGPADLYVGLQSDVLGPELCLFAGDNSLQPYSSVGPVKWRSNTTGGINARILPDIDMSSYPGTYTFYFFMTPPGRLDVGRLWISSLVIGGGSSVITDNVTGTWHGNWQSSAYGISGTFTADITQHGSTLNGKIDVPQIGMTNADLKGTVNENMIKFGDIDDQITFSGTVSGGSSASGTYVYPHLGDNGNWQGTR